MNSYCTSLLIHGPVTLTWSDIDGAPPKSRSFRIDVPEQVTFSAVRPRIVSARPALEPEGVLTLNQLAVSGPRFGREVAPEPGEPTSSPRFRVVSCGSDVGESHRCRVGYSVILRVFEGYVRQLQVENGDGADNTIAVDLEGTVERVAVGPRGREPDVAPTSWHLYHNQGLDLFAAAPFVWGTLWSLRRLVGG